MKRPFGRFVVNWMFCCVSIEYRVDGVAVSGIYLIEW